MKVTSLIIRYLILVIAIVTTVDFAVSWVAILLLPTTAGKSFEGEYIAPIHDGVVGTPTDFTPYDLQGYFVANLVATQENEDAFVKMHGPFLYWEKRAIYGVGEWFCIDTATAAADVSGVLMRAMGSTSAFLATRVIAKYTRERHQEGFLSFISINIHNYGDVPGALLLLAIGVACPWMVLSFLMWVLTLLNSLGSRTPGTGLHWAGVVVGVVYFAAGWSTDRFNANPAFVLAPLIWSAVMVRRATQARRRVPVLQR
jgi:hypothetical protein